MLNCAGQMAGSNVEGGGVKRALLEEEEKKEEEEGGRQGKRVRACHASEEEEGGGSKVDAACVDLVLLAGAGCKNRAASFASRVMHAGRWGTTTARSRHRMASTSCESCRSRLLSEEWSEFQPLSALFSFLTALLPSLPSPFFPTASLVSLPLLTASILSLPSLYPMSQSP